MFFRCATPRSARASPASAPWAARRSRRSRPSWSPVATKLRRTPTCRQGDKARKPLTILVGTFVVLGELGVGSALFERRAAAQARGPVQAPRFEVDPRWPKPLPNKWILGQTIGV